MLYHSERDHNLLRTQQFVGWCEEVAVKYASRNARMGEDRSCLLTTDERIVQPIYFEPGFRSEMGELRPIARGRPRGETFRGSACPARHRSERSGSTDCQSCAHQCCAGRSRPVPWNVTVTSRADSASWPDSPPAPQPSSSTRLPRSAGTRRSRNTRSGQSSSDDPYAWTSHTHARSTPPRWPVGGKPSRPSVLTDLDFKIRLLTVV